MLINFYIKKYKKEETEYIKNGIITKGMSNFLNQSDCEGKITKKQSTEVYKIIKNLDDEIDFGKAKMSDFKKLFSDNSTVRWI